MEITSVGSTIGIHRPAWTDQNTGTEYPEVFRICCTLNDSYYTVLCLLLRLLQVDVTGLDPTGRFVLSKVLKNEGDGHCAVFEEQSPTLIHDDGLTIVTSTHISCHSCNV